MPDYAHRTDRELLHLLDAIAADPSAYVPSAHGDALAVLAARHPGRTQAEIGVHVADQERAHDARHAWLHSAAQCLLHGSTSVPSGAPDQSAVGFAVDRAVQAATASVLREAALILCIPALLVLGLVHLGDPDSPWLQPFHYARHVPYIRVLSGLPAAMALLLKLPFLFLPPEQAALFLALLFVLLGIAAYVHLRQGLLLRARLRVLRTSLLSGPAPPTTNSVPLSPR